MLLGSALLSAKSVCWLGRLFRQRFLGIAFVAASIAFAGAACSGTAEEITVDRYRLSNGLEVLLHEDHTVPLVHVSVRYRVGGREDPPGKSGLAHLAEHMMFEGSLNVKPGEHFEIVGGAGGADANAFTGMDSTE
ncbi:MAG TPA: insulinase family protein, partial [Polyangia bacterium]